MYLDILNMHQIHIDSPPKMKIYPSRTGETTSLIHYPLVSCLQGNTQKRNAAFFCPSQRFTQMPLGQIKQTGVKPKWFTVPQSGVL